MLVNLRLKRTANDADRGQAARALASFPGVNEVTQTFPDENDDELASLYVLKDDPGTLEPTLKALQSQPYVAYAEAIAPRKLIR